MREYDDLDEEMRLHYDRMLDINITADDYSELSEKGQLLLTVRSFFEHVANGGLAAFFMSTDGGLAIETLSWLKRIDMPEYHRLLDRGLSLYQELFGRPRECRSAWWSWESQNPQVDDLVEQLDDEFYKLDPDHMRIVDAMRAIWPSLAD